MKTQISKHHTDAVGVQRPTILNITFNPALLWRAFFMLLLIAAMVVPGAAQGIYVSNLHFSGNRQAYIGEYNLDGTTVNPKLVTMPPNSFVEGFTLFGSNLLVPYYLYTDIGTVHEYSASSGTQTGFSLHTIPTMVRPHAAAVSEGKLFVVNISNANGVSEYDATTGALLNASLTSAGSGYIAALPGPGGTVNLFVTNPGSRPYSGSVQKITVRKNNTALPPTTLASGLNYPEGIAVSEDGNYVYVVIPNINPLYTVGQINQYDATTGAPVNVPLVPNISGTPMGLAVSGSNLLVTLRDGNAVGEYDATRGATVNASLITGLDYPEGIAVVPGDGTTFCTPPPSNMVAWYSFDQTGGVQYDLANGHDATAHLTQSVQGKVSNALQFDGSDSYVEVPYNASLDIGTGNFSIDAWVKIASPADYSGVVVLVDKRQYGPSLLRGFHFFLYNGRLGLQLAVGTGYTNYLSTATVKADNNWHLVAVTVVRNSTTGGTWYIDGEVPPTENPFNPTGRLGDLIAGAPLEIGVREASLGGGGFFKGGLDELEIFNKALSAAEVLSLYQAGSAGKCK